MFIQQVEQIEVKPVATLQITFRPAVTLDGILYELHKLLLTQDDSKWKVISTGILNQNPKFLLSLSLLPVGERLTFLDNFF